MVPSVVLVKRQNLLLNDCVSDASSSTFLRAAPLAMVGARQLVPSRNVFAMFAV